MVDDADDDRYEEEPPSAEELALIRKATPDETKAVDALLIGQCEPQWKEVAMVVGDSIYEFATTFPNLPFVYMQLRIQALVDSGILEAQGDLAIMRRSEIRLAQKT